MIPRRTITLLFLAFAILIGFYNALLGKYIYCGFIVPFAIASFVELRIAKHIELFGMLIVAIYIMAFESLYVGIMLMIVCAIFFLLLGMSREKERIFIYSTAPIVWLCSFVNPYDAPGYILGAGLDMSLYLLVALCVHIAIDHYKSEIKNEKPLDFKCLDALERARDTAREALEIAKERGSHG